MNSISNSNSNIGYLKISFGQSLEFIELKHGKADAIEVILNIIKALVI